MRRSRSSRSRRCSRQGGELERKKVRVKKMRFLRRGLSRLSLCSVELRLVETNVAGDDDALLSGAPEAIGLGVGVIAYEKSRFSPNSKFLAFWAVEVGVECLAAVHPELGEVGLGSKDEFVWCSRLASSRRPIPDVGCCSDCLGPEILGETSGVEHGGGHGDEDASSALSNAVLLGSLGRTELLMDALGLAESAHDLVIEGVVRTEGLERLVEAVLERRHVLLEKLDEGRHVLRTSGAHSDVS